MTKDFYDNLRDKTTRIVKEGLRLAEDETYLGSTSNHGKCASCLAATARNNVDKVDHGWGFSPAEDVCMLEARGILAEKLGWKIL